MEHDAVFETRQIETFVFPVVFAVTVIWLPLIPTFATDGFELLDTKKGPAVLAVITEDWPLTRDKLV